MTTLVADPREAFDNSWMNDDGRVQDLSGAVRAKLIGWRRQDLPAIEPPHSVERLVADLRGAVSAEMT